MQEKQYIREDEIDLKELFKTIWDKKVFIFIFTAIITILSIISALSKKPIYEVKSVVKIGYIGNNLVENSEFLKKKLDIIFQVNRTSNNLSKNNPIVSNVSIVKKIDNLIEVSTQAFSNEEAISKNKEVLTFIQKEYRYKIDEYNFNTGLEIKNLKLSLKNIQNIERINIENQIKKINTQDLQRIDSSIKMLKTQKIPNLDKKIKFLSENEINLINNKLSFNNKKINEYEKNIKIISSKNSKTDTQSLISATQILSNQNLVLSLQNRIEDLNKQKAKILNFDIKNLEDEKYKLIEVDLKELKIKKENIKNDKLRNLILNRDVLLKEKENKLIDAIKVKENQLSENYIKNSDIIGDMIINDYPIKPKKKLIVVVSFVTAFIISIFLVFFMQFIKDFKKEEI